MLLSLTKEYILESIVRMIGLDLGHDARLIPATFVKPYLKSQKNDALDAEAICEAVQRPKMRYVAMKSEEASAVLCLHISVNKKCSTFVNLMCYAFVNFRGGRSSQRLGATLVDGGSERHHKLEMLFP